MATTPPPKGLRLLGLALHSRKAGCMLGLGFSSGLPFALLIGTLNVWLVEAGITLATIGVLSWIGLAYSFKFLWAPLVDRMRLPLLEAMGRRRSWIILCQLVLAAGLALLVATDPHAEIGRFAAIAFVCALASATQDIAIDAWRIDVADGAVPLELLSAVSQFGYRVAAIIGGAVALFMAARMSWPQVFAVMAALMACAMGVTLLAPDTPRPLSHAHDEDAAQADLAPAARGVLLALVLAAWGWAVLTVLGFMHAMLAGATVGGRPPSVAGFTRAQGPWIVAATVGVPLLAAFLVRFCKDHGLWLERSRPAGEGPADHVWGALVAPLVELVERMGGGVLVLIGFILSYALCYNLWSSFAGPFYIGAMHYTKDQVAFASKIFGIIMTMLGISAGGYLFARLGRFPTVLIGAILPPLGNLLYADLADGGAGIDRFAHGLGLDRLALAFGSDERMTRLLVAICYENIATGIALTAFVAYLSGIVSKRYTAIQYALLSSLTFLVGTLGRGVVGEAFDRYGYASVFRLTALAGLVGVAFVLLEWARVRRAGRGY